MSVRITRSIESRSELLAMTNDKNKHGVPQATHERLKNQKAAIAKDLEELQVKHAEIIAEKKNVEDSYQSMKVDFDNLKEKYNTLKMKVNKKRGRIADLVPQVESLKSKVENLVGFKKHLGSKQRQLLKDMQRQKDDFIDAQMKMKDMLFSQRQPEYQALSGYRSTRPSGSSAKPYYRSKEHYYDYRSPEHRSRH